MKLKKNLKIIIMINKLKLQSLKTDFDAKLSSLK